MVLLFLGNRVGFFDGVLLFLGNRVGFFDGVLFILDNKVGALGSGRILFFSFLEGRNTLQCF